MLESNNPDLKSWVEVPEGSDFPIQNIPFGVFSTEKKTKRRVGVAIGDKVLDLNVLYKNGYLKYCGVHDNVFKKNSLNPLLALGRKTIRKVRERVSELLRAENMELQKDEKIISKALKLQNKVRLHLPVKPSDYTDFYSSMEHATNVGSMFRDPDNALLPNWKHLPVGYHGRSSSIIGTGVPVRRPNGQTKPPGDETPSFGPSKKLDFELEMAFVTCGKTKLGEPIKLEDTEDYIAGLVLFNDWSARDIQAWEYVPLGPFLGKSFASSMSPWLVTLDALEPYRVEGPKQDTPVLPYLKFEGKKSFDIQLEVSIKPQNEEETTVCHSNFKYMYWNIFQQLAHQTVNGCNISVGDIYASGTISGPDKGSYGSMLELSWNGKEPLDLGNNVSRSFILDGDTVSLRGYADNGKTRIGFGEVSNIVLPAN